MLKGASPACLQAYGFSFSQSGYGCRVPCVERAGRTTGRQLGGLAAAIAAPLALASTPANATIGPVTRHATFTAIQPANEFSQFNTVWTHPFSVDVDATGAFERTARERFAR